MLVLTDDGKSENECIDAILAEANQYTHLCFDNMNKDEYFKAVEILEDGAKRFPRSYSGKL